VRAAPGQHCYRERLLAKVNRPFKAMQFVWMEALWPI
jgi:hypothetical protein